jgi:hypothetical protein
MTNAFFSWHSFWHHSSVFSERILFFWDFILYDRRTILRLVFTGSGNQPIGIDERLLQKSSKFPCSWLIDAYRNTDSHSVAGRGKWINHEDYSKLGISSWNHNELWRDLSWNLGKWFCYNLHPSLLIQKHPFTGENSISFWKTHPFLYFERRSVPDSFAADGLLPGKTWQLRKATSIQPFPQAEIKIDLVLFVHIILRFRLDL